MVQRSRSVAHRECLLRVSIEVRNQKQSPEDEKGRSKDDIPPGGGPQSRREGGDIASIPRCGRRVRGGLILAVVGGRPP